MSNIDINDIQLWDEAADLLRNHDLGIGLIIHSLRLGVYETEVMVLQDAGLAEVTEVGLVVTDKGRAWLEMIEKENA